MFSTRGRYGLKAMYIVATQGEGPVSIRQVASEEKLSEQYLEQIFKKLKDAGLLISLRGAGGGYRLSRPPGEITVGDVLRPLEDLAPVNCVEGKCSNEGECTTRRTWRRIYDDINRVLDSYTLLDILEENDRK